MESPSPPHVAVDMLWRKQASTDGTPDLNIPGTNIPLAHTTFDQYLAKELNVSELDHVYPHLWWAGVPRRYIKPLHHQRVLRRDTVVSERFHLVVRDNTLYLKPIPSCFLSQDFFKEYVLGHRFREDLVLGFLSSYLGLIVHESDLHIANELHLFPEVIEWDKWLTLSKFLTQHVGARETPRIFHNRYDFGELRLHRLNILVVIYTLKVRGYARLSTTYRELFHSFWSIMTVLVFVFLSTAFSAFSLAQANPNQPPAVGIVGLWFAITTLFLLAALIVFPLLWFLVLFIDNVHFAYVNRVLS